MILSNIIEISKSSENIRLWYLLSTLFIFFFQHMYIKFWFIFSMNNKKYQQPAHVITRRLMIFREGITIVTSVWRYNSYSHSSLITSWCARKAFRCFFKRGFFLVFERRTQYHLTWLIISCVVILSHPLRFGMRWLQR